MRFAAVLLVAAVSIWSTAALAHNDPVVCGQLPAMTGDVTRPSGSCTGSVASGATLTDTLNQEYHVSTGTLTATTNTTLATVAGLSQALTAGKTYSCLAHLTGVSGASGGIKVAFVASGSLSATSASFTGTLQSGATIVAQTTVTALGSNVAASTAVYSDLYIVGAIVVNVAGTINLQAAQNASNSTATTVLLNSTFSCVRVS